MNKRILLSIFVALTVSITFAGKTKKKPKADGYEITIKINNSKDTVCYLAYHLGNQKYVKDTTLLNKKGEFVFSGAEPLPGGIYIVYFENKKNFEIIVNNQFFRIETDTTDFTKYFETEDEENKVFYDYLKFTADLNVKATPLVKERGDLLKELKDDNLPKAKREKFESRKKEIENTLKVDFKGKVDKYRQNLFDTKGDLFVVKTFKAVEEISIPKEIPDSLKFNYYKAHFFDYIDFKDDRMMRTPIVDSKVKRYFEKMTIQNPDSIIKEADYLLNKVNPNSELLRYLIITITNKYAKSKIMCMDKVYVHMIQNYYATGKAYWADSADVAEFTDRARTLSWTMCEAQAPNLMLRDTNEIFVQLYKVEAPYTIAYFWDPDCGHCKKVTPKLVKAYNEYLKGIGVKIYAVTTTRNKTKWLKFIKEKGMQDFINVYDPEHKSGFRQLYDITSTPKAYIMDKNKKIIARQLGVDQISDYMKQRVKMDKEKK